MMSDTGVTNSRSSSNARSIVEWTPTLVARLRDGDAQAGELLIGLYHGAMVRFCCAYLDNIDDAEDAVQDVFLKVHRSSMVPADFRAWLYRIARNHCLNLRRNRLRRRDRCPLPGAAEPSADCTGQLTRLVNAEQRTRIALLLAALPQAYGELLRLRYVEELSRAEIAQVLELPESTVKSRLYEALKRLREHVRPLG